MSEKKRRIQLRAFSISALLLWSHFLFSQPLNDACSNAFELCPQSSVSITNAGATHATYPNGEDDFNFCFVPQNTVWVKFKTNENGGKATIKLDDLNFSTPAGSGVNISLVHPQYPCDGSTYISDTCFTDIQLSTTLQIDSLLANTTYYLCFGGITTNGVISAFDGLITVSGEGVNREEASIGLYTPKQIICEKEEVVITANLSNCPDSTKYRWFKNGQFFTETDSAYIVTSTLKNGDVISVENTCYVTCVDTVVNALPPFVVKTVQLSVSNDTIINHGDRAFVQCYSTVDSLWWEPSYLVQDVNASSTYVKPDETTTFYANAIVNGCPISRPILVEVRDDFVIYNTFSPNGDGINDTWIIEGIEKYPNAQVSVFTRWGQRVFFIMGYNRTKAWDGTQNGRKLEAGTYFYTIDLSEDVQDASILKGSINLVR